MKRVNLIPLIFLAFGLFFSSLAIASFSELGGYTTPLVSESTTEPIGDYRDESAPKISYDRIDEVKKKCKSVLSSASELKLDEISRDLRKAKKKLAFRYGDWNQDPGDSPILPFDSTNTPRNSSSKPLNLVSFKVTDLDLPHRTRKYIGVNGVLLLAITTFNELPSFRSYGSREFELWPSHTQLKISFQGVYLENDNDEERVLCMLGETMLPSRESDSPTDPWKWVKDHEPPPLLQDDQIMLLLRYPKSFTLTNRVIKGELKSLNPKPNLKFFDKINLFSQLSKSVSYDFVSDDLVSKACDPYPYKNETFISNSGIDVYKSKRFCDLLQRVTSRAALTVVPNWKCNGADEFCSKLGPFASDGDIKSTDGSFKDVKLYMQNVHCQETDAITKVSAVFRAVHPNENLYISGMRSGLSNMTVTAEGIWKPSSGQLCMVGCRRGQADACNARVCLYIPTTFSIRQRSILVGTFSCLNTEKNSAPLFFPLSFEKLVEPMDMQNYFQSALLHPFYTYSKLSEAGVILEKNQEFSFGTVIKKSVLRFPKLEDSDDYLSSLSLLAEDLTFHTPAFTKKRGGSGGTNLGMDVLSLGPLFGLFWRTSNFSTPEQSAPYRTKAQYTEKQLLLNVSAQISLTGEAFGNFSVIYLEGLYDEHVGKMYLAGCRDVRASWKILFESADLESGLDCLIDVVVSYPPTKSRWLADPTAKVSVSSRRPDDDPLYFNPVKLETTPIFYRRQREDILSRAGVEGILRVLTLTFSIGCITSQLFHVSSNADSLPFVSLVMLGVQALGYSLPLITGAEALFKRKAASAAATYETPSYDLQRSQWFNVIDYTVKLLVMLCFLLTLRLCQKVWKSRARLLTRTTQEPRKVPSDRRVLLIAVILHALGYILALILHPARRERFAEVYGGYNTPAVANWWQTATEEYIGLVQDFFLLPQVVANFMWQIDSIQPLRKLYYLGITLVRLFPHVYDYIIGSVPDPYFIGEEHEFVNPNFDFFSKFGDVSIPVTVILLAVVVFVQQRWDYDKLSQALTIGRFRILPSPSVKYERVMSQPIESEMVSGVDGNRRDDEE
uniref:RING-type E3 ubiquitin transferase n=1 Tax=Noccaea caerulescens TaxID=107243 RepID=A0A1J3EIY0_NOCCA